MTDEPELTDLVMAARTGEERAFAKLVERVQRRVRMWAGRLIDDPDTADDIAQDVMIGLQRKVVQFRGDSRFETWLFTLTRSRALNHLRAEKRRTELREARGADMRDDMPRDHQDATTIAALVLECFDTLPPKQRQVLELVDLRGLSPTEAARDLGLRAVTVRAHLFKGRRTVRLRMLDQHETLVNEFLS